MTSRRPMTRSFSGNGRTSSFSEEEGSSSNGRNTYLSNVRPENRSTLCTVMAQLTEDVQPSFETTLKSKAVSENCNVKFTCVVTGYPAPELKWYKDDMEMDRYCGLPKYEIRRNGKTHTLHIYNCTLDDAAIYQVSASNSKGIVSCSGVLEVGTMSEYQIHQRFFAKLKAKAEKKRQDLEDKSNKEKGEAEKVQKETPAPRSPERTPRKRPIPQPTQSQEESPAAAANAVNQITAQELVQPPAVAATPTEVKKDSEDDLAKKKIKISNGVDSPSEEPDSPNSVSVHVQPIGNGGENHYDGGMSLAQFLSEALQSQAAEEKQVSNSEETAPGVDTTQEEDSTKQTEEEMEQDIVQVNQDVKEANKERSQPTPPSRQHVKSPKEHKEHKEHKEPRELKEHRELKDHREYKDHKDHHIQASLSSMLHSVKDFFFGKNKKDVHERTDRHKDTSDTSSTSSITEQTPPPSFYLQAEKWTETEAKEDTEMAVEFGQLRGSPTDVSRRQEDVCSAESPMESLGHVTEGAGADQAMEITAAEEAPLSSVQLLSEMAKKDDNRSESKLDVPEHQPKEATSLPVERFTADTQLGVKRTHSPPFQRHHTQGASEDSNDSLPQPAEESLHVSTFESEPQRTQHINDLAVSLQEEENMSCVIDQTPAVPDRKESNEEKAGQQAVVDGSVVQEVMVEPTSVIADSAQSAVCQSVTTNETPGWNSCVCANEAQETQKTEEMQETTEVQIPIETIPLIQISTIEDRKDIEPVSEMNISLTEYIQDSQASVQNEKLFTEFVPDITVLPAIKIFSTEDIPEIQAVVPIICVEDEILSPTPEVTQTDVKEGPTFIEQLSQEMDSAVKKQEFSNWSNVIIQNDFVSDFCTEKEVEGMSQVQESSPIHYPIPIINVSCTEEAAGLAPEKSPSIDAATLPLFVTPLFTDLSEYRDMSGLREMTELKEPPTDHREMAEHKEVTRHVLNTELSQEPAIEDKETLLCDSGVMKQKETPEKKEKPDVTEISEKPKHRLNTDQREANEHSNAATTELKDSAEAEHKEVALASGVDTQQTARQSESEPLEQNVAENKLPVVYEGPQPEVNVMTLSKSVEDSIESEITQSLKEARIESFMSVERLSFKPPPYPSLSPASLRKFMSKTSADTDSGGDRQSDKADDSLSGGSTPTSSLSCESSPRLKRRDSLSLIRSATPEELASGARRKIFIPKTKEDSEESANKKDSPYMSPGQTRRASFLQPPSGQNTPPVERRSPLLNRRKATLEVPKMVEEIPGPEELSTKREEKSGDKKPDPLKAPQVIRKIRGEPFPDASGHLKLWCQFFNVLSDSTIKWYKDEQEILEVQRSGGDESQVALAIVLASNIDCAVYGCTINNEYGSDSTDFLLSEDVMGEILLKDDLEVGEEIEMTPLMFSRGLADSGTWGGKFFGRIMTEMVHLGEGWTHKTSKAKVIYGLEPIFESGSCCIMKVQNPIPYGTKLESNLAERNQEITKQECKVQNMIREYCRIFAAEARVSENFGSGLEVVSLYLMYRPANSVPYATVEPDLEGDFETYCWLDAAGKLNSKSGTEAEQKCCTLQHWLHEWTHSNLLLTRLEGVDFKLTNIRVATKFKGYQGLTERGSPELFDQFLTYHQCNYYCGLLGLRPLKSMDSLQTPTKIKGSRSPLMHRKLSTGSGSPHLQKKLSLSPHSQRRASPKMPRKSQETEDSNSAGQSQAVVDSR